MGKTGGELGATNGENSENKVTPTDKSLQECDIFDKNVATPKMDGQTTSRVKAQAKKVSEEKRRGRNLKTKVKIVMESPQKAGPSGLTLGQDGTIIEKNDFMVICKYKVPPKLISKPTKPYEVRWGENFLNSLVPNVKQEKSILKKPYIGKKEKPRLKFSQTTVYYFEKAQVQSSVPAEGEITLSMEHHHFYTNVLPVDAFEGQKEIRQKRLNAATHRNRKNDESRNLILQIKDTDKDIVLHSVQVPTELMMEEDEKSNIIQGVREGCSCNLYCDPDICECNLNGKPCEVFIDDFPCSCKLEYCRNTNGREAFNDDDAQINDVDLPRSPSKEKEIKSGRINKRKQSAPARYRRH